MTLYRRRVRWSSPKDCRRFSAQVLCLDKYGCTKLAEFRKEGSRDAAKWVMTELFRKAEQDRPSVSEDDPQPEPVAPMPAPVPADQMTVFDARCFGAKLDAIIAQCVMMKAQIEQMGVVRTEMMN